MSLNIAARGFPWSHLLVVEHDRLEYVLQRGRAPDEVQEVQGEEEGVVQQAQYAGHKAEGTEQQGLRKQGGGDCIQRFAVCV